MHQDPTFDTSDTIPVARAGAAMRAGDAIRLALEIAEAAIDVAERRGGAAKTIAALRMQASRLRAEV